MLRRTPKSSPQRPARPPAEARKAPVSAMPHSGDIENLPLNDAPDSAAPLSDAAEDSTVGDFANNVAADGPVTTASGSLSDLPTSFELEAQRKVSEPSARWYHAAFHTVTAMVGAGVLALPYSFSYLTWPGGLICLALATIVSLYCSHILAEMHELPDQPRQNRYRDLGRTVLGRKAANWTVIPIQFAVCVGLDIAYTLTAGQSLQAVQNPSCNAHTVARTSDHDNQNCSTALSWWIAGFAMLQIAMSQLRDFHSLWWVSLIGALMSALYSGIAFGASVAAYKPGVSHSIRPGSTSDRLFGLLNALGTILFAFGGQSVQLEIQATLAKPPSPYVEMMKGIMIAYVIIVFAYFGVASAGFAAFGNGVNPDILLSISQPRWLVKAANLMVVVHVAASFQLFAHPVFEAAEGVATRCVFRKTPDREPPLLLRVGLRTLYCGFCAGITIVLPFFNDVIGLVGSAGFVPLSFIFPCLFYILTRRYRAPWEYWLNVVIIAVMSAAGLLAVVASARNLIQRAQTYHA